MTVTKLCSRANTTLPARWWWTSAQSRPGNARRWSKADNTLSSPTLPVITLYSWSHRTATVTPIYCISLPVWSVFMLILSDDESCLIRLQGGGKQNLASVWVGDSGLSLWYLAFIFNNDNTLKHHKCCIMLCFLLFPFIAATRFTSCSRCRETTRPVLFWNIRKKAETINHSVFQLLDDCVVISMTLISTWKGSLCSTSSFTY